MGMKSELGALVAVLLGAGAFMVIAEPMKPQAPLERASSFSQLDFEAFDRNFPIDGKACDVGIAKHKLCFQDSPLQTQLAKGQTLESHIPVMAAEFPILVAVPPKAKNQKLLRYGTMLALLNEETNIIEDLIRLDTPKSA